MKDGCKKKNARRIARNLFGASIEEVIEYLLENQTLDLLLEQSTRFNNQERQSSENLASTLDTLAASIVNKLNTW